MAAQPGRILNPKKNRAGIGQGQLCPWLPKAAQVKCEVTGLQADAAAALPHGQVWGARGSLQAPGRFPKDF